MKDFNARRLILARCCLSASRLAVSAASALAFSVASRCSRSSVSLAAVVALAPVAFRADGFDATSGFVRAVANPGATISSILKR